jgi:hypothetical protein
MVRLTLVVGHGSFEGFAVLFFRAVVAVRGITNPDDAE